MKGEMMPARAPGQHPAKGETIQEHDLESRRARRDHLASETMPPDTETKPKRETWADWMPSVPATMTAAEFIQYANSRLDTGSITVDDLEVWQHDGILPDPVEVPSDPPRQLYPRAAWQVIADLLHPEWPDWQEADPAFTRQRLRSTAQIINNTAAHTADRQTWLDLTPDDFPLPELLSHDELMDRLRARGVDLNPHTLEHWRRTGVVPRPIRRQHAGALRPVYPAWYVDVLERIKQMRTDGHSLDDIREAMRPVMTMYAWNAVQWADPLASATATIDRALKTYVQEIRATLDTPKIQTVRVAFLDADGQEVQDLTHETGIA